MPAYVIADITVSDAEGYEPYKDMASAAVAAYGGRYLVRGGAVDPLEGGWEPQRVALLEFPSMEQARAFYDSPEYREARGVRQQASEGRLVLVEGL